MIRAIVELGGTYPDVVQALQEAKASGTLASRFEIDALPRAAELTAGSLNRMEGMQTLPLGLQAPCQGCLPARSRIPSRRTNPPRKGKTNRVLMIRRIHPRKPSHPDPSLLE